MRLRSEAKSMNLLNLELAALLIGLWVASLVVLWKVVGSAGRPGIVQNAVVVDIMMLISVAFLITGFAFLIKGSGFFD